MVSKLEKRETVSKTQINELQATIRKRTEAAIPEFTPVQRAEIEKSTMRKNILEGIKYNEDGNMTPGEWIRNRDALLLAGHESEWEGVAIEESRKIHTLQDKLSSQDSYVKFLEHRLNGTSE